MDLVIDLIYELVMYGKSLPGGLLRLRAWIWPSTKGFNSKIWQISLHWTWWGFEHKFATCHYRNRTTKKGRVYENVTRCIRMSYKALSFSSNACCRSLKIRSCICLTEAWIQAFEKKLLVDQRFSRSGGGGARGVSSRCTKKSHWKSHE